MLELLITFAIVAAFILCGFLFGWFISWFLTDRNAVQSIVTIGASTTWEISFKSRHNLDKTTKTACEVLDSCQLNKIALRITETYGGKVEVNAKVEGPDAAKFYNRLDELK